MASVNELLLAAQAEKSPFIRLLEGAAQGFQQSQEQMGSPLDQLTQMAALQQQQQQMAQQQEEMAARKRLEAEYQADRAARSGHRNVEGLKGSSPLKSQRLDQHVEKTWTRDESGGLKKVEKIKPVETAGGLKPPSGYQYKPDGTLTPIPGGPADKPKTSYFQQVVDREAAKEYADFVIGGGYSDVMKSLNQLRPVLDKLDPTSKNYQPSATGPIVGNIPDRLRAFTEKGQTAINMREAVEEIVQRNLKKVLGGQFTEREGEKLVARAYNPRLDESKNRVRVERLINQIQKMAEAKRDAARYLEENQTLQGYRPAAQIQFSENWADEIAAAAGLDDPIDQSEARSGEEEGGGGGGLTPEEEEELRQLEAELGGQ